jgi:hypothetical protein
MTDLIGTAGGRRYILGENQGRRTLISSKAQSDSGKPLCRVPGMMARKLTRLGEAPLTKPEDPEAKQPSAHQWQGPRQGHEVPVVQPVYVNHQVVII